VYGTVAAGPEPRPERPTLGATHPTLFRHGQEIWKGVLQIAKIEFDEEGIGTIVDGSTLEQSLNALQLCLPTVDEGERPALVGYLQRMHPLAPIERTHFSRRLTTKPWPSREESARRFSTSRQAMAIGNSEESVRDMDVRSQPLFVTTNDGEQPFGTEN
jgi:hypothetical protein